MYLKFFNLKILCHILNISVSGYYKFKNNFLNKKLKIFFDENIFKIIFEIFNKYKAKYGYRRITMVLNNIYNLKINSKKVYRIMKNNGILAKIRRKNNISFGLKKSLEHKICKNILNRDFSGKPFKKFRTDISYLQIKGKKYFLSILKDFVNSEIISYEVSDNLGLSFVLNTIKKASKKVNLNGKIIHSDQGFHYTNSAYQNLLKKFGVIQSMSRKGNCLDNAPTESFFGHLKYEVDFKNISSFQELKNVIDNYIYFYNYHRFQWNRKKNDSC